MSSGRLLGPAFRHIPFSIPALDERESFIRRTLVGALLVGAAGAVALLLFGRPGWAVAFGLGAAVSLGNFHLITRAVTRLTDPDTREAPGHLWKGALFRFAIVGAVLFVAVVVLRVNILALMAGLLATQLFMIGYWIVRSARTNPE
jgi:hypothetical protein